MRSQYLSLSTLFNCYLQSCLYLFLTYSLNHEGDTSEQKNSSWILCLKFTKASLPNYSCTGPQARAQNYSVWGSNGGFDVEPLMQDNANDIY